MGMPQFAFRLVAHANEDLSTLTLWAGQRGLEPRTDLRVRVVQEGLHAPFALTPLPDWERLALDSPTVHAADAPVTGSTDVGGDPEPPTWICTHELTNLAPGSLLQAWLEPADGTVDPQLLIETFIQFLAPLDRLPDRGRAAGFTVMLGSCNASLFEPAEAIGPAVTKIRKNWPKLRPHLTFLVGDQVYIDQPAGPDGDFNRVRSTEWLWNHIPQHYRQVWRRSGALLDGPVVMVPDDHDYWNDFPNPPHWIPWFGLATDPDYRRRFRTVASAHVRDYQRAAPVKIFNVGGDARPDLSFCVIDTRTHRQRADGSGRFMRQPDFNRVTRWLSRLRCPGVLVMSEPLFHRATSVVTEFDGIPIPDDLQFIGDYHLRSYSTQWEPFEQSIASAPHDVLVLAGDVHFGRFSRVLLAHGQSEDGTPRAQRIHEIVASPIAQLPSAAGRDDPSEVRFGGKPVSRTAYVQQRMRAPYSEPVTVPGPKPPLFTDDVAHPSTVPHVMTLSFWRGEGRCVDVEVTAWSTMRKRSKAFNKDENPGYGTRLISQRIRLDAHATGAEASEIRHAAFTWQPAERILGLGNPDERWFFATVDEVVDDIASNRAIYRTVKGDSRSNVIPVQEPDGRWHLWTRPNEQVTNLDDLPRGAPYIRHT